MSAFYAAVDIYLVTSAHEGEPLTLIEAMAAGCFPVCSDVGVVPELIRHGENGLVVEAGTADGFRRALEWCDENAAFVRTAGRANAETMARERDWSVSAQFFARAYREALAHALAPRFRNDDVAWDTSLASLQKLSGVFGKHGQRQIHGVCLNGRNNSTCARRRCRRVRGPAPAVETPEQRDQAAFRGVAAWRAAGFVGWLDRTRDELALHGLYHTDYAAMSEAEQDRDMGEGLRAMRQLFPSKRVRQASSRRSTVPMPTPTAARRHGLEVLAERC